MVVLRSDRRRLDMLCYHLLAPAHQCDQQQQQQRRQQRRRLQLYDNVDTCGASAEPAEHMLVVRGGTIIDGTGTSRFVADLAVGHDGKESQVQILTKWSLGSRLRTHSVFEKRII